MRFKKKILVMIAIHITVLLTAMNENHKFQPTYIPTIEENFHFQNNTDGLSSPFLSFHDFMNSAKNYVLGQNPNQYSFHYRGKQKKSELIVNGSLFSGYDYQFHKNETISFVHKGFAFEGQYINSNRTINFDARWTSGHFTGDRDFTVENAYFLNGFFKNSIEDSYIYYDELTANIDWSTERQKFAIGRDSFTAEETISSSIILNDDVPKYGYFSYQFNWKNFKLDFLHGSLIADEIDSSHEYKDFDDRYFAMHKLSFETKSKKWYFYFGENIIYGSRGIDVSYCLPHTFYRVTEHRQGDRDNVLIFAGWKMTHKKIKIYQNMIFDELRKSEIFGDWWGNKYAIQTGITVGNTIPISFEVTAIRPWLYTHKYHLNKYSHYNQPLGFSLGSNLIHYAMQTTFQLPYNIKTLIQGSYTRQGSVGNSYTINYNDRPSDTATWLDGDITDTIRSDIAFEKKIFERHFLKLTYHYEKNIDADENNYIYCSFLTRY
jgi:hypothetical protein